MAKKQSKSKPRPKSIASRQKEAAVRAVELQNQLTEASIDFFDNFVDPLDEFRDAETGQLWLEVGSGGRTFHESLTATNLHGIREQSRKLVLTNEWAINAIENRISYTIGKGHQYTAVVRKGKEVAVEKIGEAQEFIDEWMRVNKWHKRQQETRRRIDRDGEAFIREAVDGSGMTVYRFIEPGQIVTPESRSNDDNARMGILTAAGDVEDVIGYFVDGNLKKADTIQHRKANVDANVKRGIPLLFPVRKNLQRAEKLQRNMGVVADIQTAIALIRKHDTASGGDVQNFVNSQADISVTNTRTGNVTQHKHLGPGTIIDAPKGVEYDFPAKGIDATRFVAVLASELRAIASRLLMPEFMLSADASNANFASTLVSEGPVVKLFERLQSETWEDDKELLWRAMHTAVEASLLSVDLSVIDIDVTFPTLATHDRLKDTQADQILVQNKAMSRRTMGEKAGLDMDAEEALIEGEREEFDPFLGLRPGDTSDGNDDAEDDAGDD